MRAIEPLATAPALNLTPPEVEALSEDLRADQAIDSPWCRRREPRQGSAPYRPGVRLEWPRPSMAPMVLALAGAHRYPVRALQQCLRAGAWAADTMLPRHGQAGDRDRGDDAGGLPRDGRDVPTQGPASVGVKRQDGGALGTRANGQAGVCLGYARQQGDTWRDRRWSLPQEGVEAAADAERRTAGRVPVDRAFTTTPMVGGAMIQAVQPAGTRRGRWVAGDKACGRETTRRDHLARLGVWYAAEVAHDPQGWRERPATMVPAWSGRGRKPTRDQVVAGAPQAPPVARLAAALPGSRWSRPPMQEGSPGPIVADVGAVRVVAVRAGLPGPGDGLIRRRHGRTGALKTSRRHASADTPWPTLVRLSGLRWPLEPGVEEGQPYLGLGDDEVRSWRGWHPHLPLGLLAHLCLVRLPCRIKKPPRA